MSFTLADFVVEAILRRRLRELQDSNVLADTIEDIFGRLLDDLLKTKFGQKQLEDLVTYLQDYDISVVSAFPDSSTTNLPQISVISQNDTEAEDLTTLLDFPGEESDEIVPTEIVGIFTADSYDPKTGFVFVPDAVDISNVRYAHYYIDGDNIEHRIFTPVNDETGDKRFTIDKNLVNLNITGGRIVSAVDRRAFLTATIPSRERLLIGVHSQNSLLTKLLYSIVKHTIYQARRELEGRCIQITTLDGSDLNQALQLLPDHIYHKFITMSFISYNTFRSEEIPVIDSASPTILIEKDVVDREDNENQTVQTTP